MKLGGIVLASLLTATSCQNEEIVSNEQQNGNYSLTVSSLVDSRTYVNDEGKVLWSEGDKMYVYGTNVSGVLTLSDGANSDKGTFTGFVFGNPDNLKWAVFGDEVKGTADGAQFTISSITDPNSNSPMVGEIKNGDVQMIHLCGMVRITINNLPENANVKLTGNNIAGTAEVKEGVLQTPTYNNEIAIKVAKGNQTIEIPVFATDTEEDIDLTLSVNNKECPINAPVKVGSLSQKAIMTITCITDANGKVTGFSQAATTEEALKQAIESLKSGESISFSLADDMTLEETITVPEGATVTLNLNEKTISGSSVKGDGAIIENQGILVVQGGELTNNEVNGDAVIKNEGNLTLKEVTIIGASIDESGYPAYAIETSGTLIIEEGTDISSDRGAICIKGNGTTTINGGTFTNNNITRSLTSHVVDLSDDVQGEHTLTINGGTFQHLHENTSGGVVICNRTTNTIYVNGGNFSGGDYYGNDNLSDYGYGGTFEVKGGTFDAKPADKYIAAGYTVTQNTDNTWTVAITSEKLKDLFNNVEDGGTITLPEGTVTIPSEVADKEITIEGIGENTVIDFTQVNNVGNASITFKNLKIQGKNENIMSGFGIQGTTEHITYENCTFDGAVTNEYYGSVSYKNCTFTGTGYITTYAVSSCTFEDCVFDKADSRAVLVYSHGDNPVVVTLTDCDFYAASKGYTGVGAWTAAVEIDTTNMPTEGTSVTITDCTYDANYSGLFRDKSAAGKANAVITVDGKTVQ